MTVSNETTNVTIPSRFIQYRPGYNEISRSPTWYDNSVLYLDERDGGGNIAIVEDQNLVDNGTVRITLLQNDFRRSGTGRVNVDLYPTDSGSAEALPTGTLNVTLPTRLNGTEYWDDAIGDESVYTGVDDDSYATGVHALTLRTDSDDVRVNTVGIEETPKEGGARQNIRSPTTGDPGAGPTPQVAIRVDDVTNRRPNNPRFYVSYDVSGDFDGIEASATSTESTARDSASLFDGRGGVSLSPGFGQGQEFAVTVRAFRNGSTVAQQTIYTNADTQNPSTENDDLSRSDSAAIQSTQIKDQSNTGNNGVRYRFTYDLSSTGSFSETRLYALNRNGNGASGSTVVASRTANNVEVNPNDGTGTSYKLAVLVLDESGAVVDSRIVDDTADGNDPS
ncbi:PKD domain-containing protein [Halorubrum salipaludis]|uniref:PKD domain-containing protein n=1 Tax=Halorubrum salipaludis TaxID=2032630 RepID=A0A2A2FEK1_9EURY|nr:PKD domain-containing protein [Halorubrum salipaludis]